MILPIATVKRVYLQNQTLGSWFFNEQALCKTMELPWKDNLRSVSCIPEGDYTVTKEPPIPANDSQGRKERPYWHFRIHNVPGRSGVLVHKITYVKDLRGCIGVGFSFGDLNQDEVLDMMDSTKALQKLVEVMPVRFTLRMIKK